MSARRVTAQLWRRAAPAQGAERQLVWTRCYSYMDTAMPRVVQLALQTGQTGDKVTFASTEHGFELGSMEILPGNRVELTYSTLVKHSPGLMKLMGGTPHA